MTTTGTSSNQSERHAPVLPSRFSDALPVKLNPGEDNSNPDNYPERDLSVLQAPQIGGKPLLMNPKAKRTVTPLDLAQAAELVHDRHKQWDGTDADRVPFDPTPTPLVVRDSNRKYTFTGTRLAYVSSESAGKAQWTEITIYRTNSGIYITHRVAVTTIAHVIGCPILTRYHKRYTTGVAALAEDEFGPEDRVPCPDCKPDLTALATDDPLSLCYERDRHTVIISEYPESLIQSLHKVRHGKKSLGPLAASALQLAADRDTNLASVFYGQPA